MNRIMATIAVFMATMALCAFFAWTCGFDFDKRSPDVGFATIMTTIVAQVFAFWVWFMPDWKEGGE